MGNQRAVVMISICILLHIQNQMWNWVAPNERQLPPNVILTRYMAPQTTPAPESTLRVGLASRSKQSKTRLFILIRLVVLHTSLEQHDPAPGVLLPAMLRELLRGRLRRERLRRLVREAPDEADPATGREYRCGGEGMKG